MSATARKAIAAEDSEVYVSAATAWEITLKVRIGNLEWPPSAGTVNGYVLGQGFRPLPISLGHAELAGQLRIDHNDPFDRMLIAQTQTEDLWLVSDEKLFDAAGLRRIW